MQIRHTLTRLRQARRRHGLWGWLSRRLARAIFRSRSNSDKLSQFDRGGITYVVWINEPVGWQLYFSRSYDDAELREVLRLVQPGDVCVDVGANIGFYALNLARAVGHGGRVIAFEPLRRNALALELAAELNGFGHLAVETDVVSSRSGQQVAAICPTGYSGSTRFQPPAEPPAKQAAAYQTVTLDDYFAAHGISRVDFIKIDVEGAELEVLRGAEKLLGSRHAPRAILLELDPENMARFDCVAGDVVDYLGRYGYAALLARRQGGLQPWDAATLGYLPNVFFLRTGSPPHVAPATRPRGTV